MNKYKYLLARMFIIALLAIPTEIIIALFACHVITTSIFGNEYSTLRTLITNDFQIKEIESFL